LRGDGPIQGPVERGTVRNWVFWLGKNRLRLAREEGYSKPGRKKKGRGGVFVGGLFDKPNGLNHTTLSSGEPELPPLLEMVSWEVLAFVKLYPHKAAMPGGEKIRHNKGICWFGLFFCPEGHSLTNDIG